MKKINISINDELLERIDKFTENNYLSRSGLISLACNQYLITMEAQAMFRSMNVAFQKIADTGVIDEETRRELDEVMRVCNALQGK